MKKLLSLLIVIAMLATALAGCASEDDLKGSLDTDEKVENNDTEKDTEEDTEEVNILEVTGGSTGGVYTNEFANVKFTAPDDWTFYSDEEILEFMSIGEEFLDREDDLAYELAKQATIYSMIAQNLTTGESVQIMFENLAVTGGLKFDEKDYAASVSTQLEAITEMNYTIGEEKTVDVAGNDFLCVSATASSSGVELEQYYLMRKIGGYMMSIIITTTPSAGEGYNNIMNMFSAIEAE